MRLRWQVVEYDNRTFVRWNKSYTLLGAIVIYLNTSFKHNKAIEKIRSSS